MKFAGKDAGPRAEQVTRKGRSLHSERRGRGESGQGERAIVIMGGVPNVDLGVMRLSGFEFCRGE